MEYKAFKDIELSRLGMGTMRLPTVGDVDGAPIDYPRAEAIIDYAMASGVNYYDTAYVYHGGASEGFLGKALVARYPRESFYVATKFNINAEPDYRKTFETQLERLGTGYIDFYLCHAVMDKTCQAYLDSGCVDYLLEQKREGRIKYLGFSSHATPQYLRVFADSYGRPWDFAQIQLNYLDWEYSTTAEEYKILEERGVPVMVMEPIRGGRLARLTDDAEKILRSQRPEWSVPSWALRWVRSLTQVQTVLSGMSSLDQIADNVRTFSDSDPFTEADARALARARDAFHADTWVPCTACRYCCDGCPAGIDIPAVLDALNRSRLGSPMAIKSISKLECGMPGDCVGCGACATQCPQGIDIPALMAEVAGLMG